MSRIRAECFRDVWVKDKRDVEGWGVRLACTLCENSAEVIGDTTRSIERACVELRDTCKIARGENYYVPIAPKLAKPKTEPDAPPPLPNAKLRADVMDWFERFGEDGASASDMRFWASRYNIPKIDVERALHELVSEGHLRIAARGYVALITEIRAVERSNERDRTPAYRAAETIDNLAAFHKGEATEPPRYDELMKAEGIVRERAGRASGETARAYERAAAILRDYFGNRTPNPSVVGALEDASLRLLATYGLPVRTRLDAPAEVEPSA